MSRQLTSPSALNLQQSGQNYYFIIEKYPEASYTVTEVQMPNITLGKMGIKTPFLEFMKPGTSLSFSDLRLTFLVDEDLSNYRQLFKWLMVLKEYNILPSAQQLEAKNQLQKIGGTLLADLKSDCELHILTNKKNEKNVFRFRDCWPYSLGSVSLSVKAGTESLSCDVSLTFDEFYLAEEPE